MFASACRYPRGDALFRARLIMEATSVQSDRNRKSVRSICAGPITRKSLVLATLLFSTIASASAVYAETIRMSGTGSSLGTMRILGDAYKKVDPTFALEIVPNLGTRGALKALDQNALHFAVIGRPVSTDEAARGLIASEYGRTPFVLASARKEEAGLTLSRVAEIYAGRVSRWPDGTPVRIVLRPANDGDTLLLASFSPAIKDGLSSAMAREGMVVGVTDQDSATEITRLKGGLGTTSLALITSEKRPLYPLPIEGVMPSVQTLNDGSYPYYKAFYLVTRGKPVDAVERFSAFVQSAEGRRLLLGNGHWVDARKSVRAAPK